MLESLSTLIKSKEGKQVAIVLGVTVLTLTAIHYYNQIKITRIKIKDLQAQLKEKEEKKLNGEKAGSQK